MEGCVPDRGVGGGRRRRFGREYKHMLEALSKSSGKQDRKGHRYERKMEKWRPEHWTGPFGMLCSSVLAF